MATSIKASLFVVSLFLTPTPPSCSLLSSSLLLFSPSHSLTTLYLPLMLPIFSVDLLPCTFFRGPCMSLIESSLFPSLSGGVECRVVILCFTYHVCLFVTGLPQSEWLLQILSICLLILSFHFFCPHWVVVHCANVQNFLYLFFSWGASRLLPGSGITNNTSINDIEQMSSLYKSASFGYMPNSTIAGSFGRLTPNFLRNYLLICKVPLWFGKPTSSGGMVFAHILPWIKYPLWLWCYLSDRSKMESQSCFHLCFPDRKGCWTLTFVSFGHFIFLSWEFSI